MKEIDVLYENEEILVINKPSGIAVQGGKGIAHSLDKELPLQLGYPIYLVHRLDRDTSGLMIVAKSPFSAAKWTKLIAGKLVIKEYTAICVGILKEKKGTIRTNVVQHGQEKTAITQYNVIKEENFELDDDFITLSTVRLKIETGRMHQIRIHLASINCPVAGDDKHGNFKLNKILKKTCGIKTLQLTSSKLTLPVNGKNLVFEIG